MSLPLDLRAQPPTDQTHWALVGSAVYQRDGGITLHSKTSQWNRLLQGRLLLWAGDFPNKQVLISYAKLPVQAQSIQRHAQTLSVLLKSIDRLNLPLAKLTAVSAA